MLGGDAALDPDIEIGIIRSEELLVSLKEEYGRCLKDQRVSPRARQLTFEVLGLLRFTFDRLAYKYWDTYVAPDVLSEKREAARRNVSFPAADTEHKFRSALGKWGWQESRVQHAEFENLLLKRQPFFSEGNQWFEWLDNIVNKGKHASLSPQVQKQEKYLSISSPENGKLRISPGVSVGSITLLGSSSATIEHEIWVRFMLLPYHTDALEFCENSIHYTRLIAQDMSQRFSL